jgi:hypothetical protein
LREAFKNLGVEAAAEGDDILLRIGRGPDELFVREAVGATPAVNKEDAPRKSKRMRFVLTGATGPDKPVTTKQARESLITLSKGPARASDVATGDALELLCRNAPQEAFDH